MELDNLKGLWQQQSTEKTPGNLQVLLGKKSNSPIAKMKRNLIWELAIVVLTYGLSILFFSIAWKGKFNSVAWLYLIMGLLFLIYYIRKNKLLNEMECMACQVKSNLNKQVRILEKYVRFYLIAGTGILPLLMLFFYWFLQTQLPYINRDLFMLVSENISLYQSVFTWLSVTALLTYFYYFLNKWYVKKLYGKHIDTLKSMLNQMEDDQAIRNSL